MVPLPTLLHTYSAAYLLQCVTIHIVTTRQTTQTAAAATDTAMIITVVVPGNELRFPFAAESSPIASSSSCGDETVLPGLIQYGIIIPCISLAQLCLKPAAIDSDFKQLHQF